MIGISLLAVTLAAAVPDEAAVRAFATDGAKVHVARILKAPAGADYGVYRLAPLGKTAIYPGNRYLIEGYVDANNTLGTKLRGEWDAVVRIDEADKLVLLGLTFTGLDGDTSMVYEAPAVDWCRPDVYRAINEGFVAKVEAISVAKQRLPKRSRKAYLDREVDQYLAGVRREYGLTVGQIGKILRK